jgi:phage FluMu gp28-like protein
MSFDYNIILKSRQLGISTLVAGYALWLCIFNADKNVLVIATKQEVAKTLVTKVREMYDCLPMWIKRNSLTTEHNKLSIRFKNGSQIKAESSSPDAGRSLSLSLLVLDEAAFITDISRIWTAAQQTLATGGKCVMLSTPCVTGDTKIKIRNKKTGIISEINIEELW